MGNELDDATVEAMMTATEGGVPDRAQVVHREGGGFIGLDTLELADQYAPIGDARARFSWPEAVEIVDSSFARAFSPRLCRDLSLLRRRRDMSTCLPRPGKAAGAYCTSVSKAILPYVLMNYTERLA